MIKILDYGLIITSSSSHKASLVECDSCHKERVINKYNALRRPNHYCMSCKCLGERNPFFGKGELVSGENHYFYGKKHTEETKNKISIEKLGQKPSEETRLKLSLARRGEKNHMYGKPSPRLGTKCSEETKAKMRGRTGEKSPRYNKKLSEETKRKMSLAQKGKPKPHLRGRNSPNWKTDINREDRINRRLSFEDVEWSLKVKRRDNFTCQISGRRGGNLTSHHVNGYNWDKDGRHDINNGITLCEEIHDLFHKYYGKGNNTKEQWEEFLTWVGLTLIR